MAVGERSQWPFCPSTISPKRFFSLLHPLNAAVFFQKLYKQNVPIQPAFFNFYFTWSYLGTRSIQLIYNIRRKMNYSKSLQWSDKMFPLTSSPRVLIFPGFVQTYYQVVQNVRFQIFTDWWFWRSWPFDQRSSIDLHEGRLLLQASFIYEDSIRSKASFLSAKLS